MGSEIMPLPKKFYSSKVLAVEGLDEYNFFVILLEKEGISGVEIFDVGGKDKFKKNMPVVIKTPGFY